MFFFKKNTKQSYPISGIYQNIVERSRSKFFYLEKNIEDSFESRFDLIILHAFIIFYYLKEIEKKNKLSQLLFDHMFNDFDNNLREMGFGDIAVNKKMKVFISAFYGRIAQYSKGLDKIISENENLVLKKSISNNLYKGVCENENDLFFFQEYILENLKNFQSKSKEKNINNNFTFINLAEKIFE
tara:strand:+ start:267 stop:821 length:555 start_codon:yes stop_codon:yes gene_type:complete